MELALLDNKVDDDNKYILAHTFPVPNQLYMLNLTTTCNTVPLYLKDLTVKAQTNTGFKQCINSFT